MSAQALLDPGRLAQSYALVRREPFAFPVAHGPLPCQGDRRVIQVAWLVRDQEKRRNTQRDGVSRLLKQHSRGLDRRIAAGRDRNAAHPD